MSERNSDIERAIAAFGGVAMTYHSFGPFVVRPRTPAGAQPFTYNEFGEAEYIPAPEKPQAPVAPAPMAAEPLYDALPVVQPAVLQPQKPVSIPQPAPMTPQQAARPSRPVPPPAKALPPVEQQPAPPPFFPLLAAAMPNATEPSYAPSYPPAPPPAHMPEPAGRAAPSPAPSAVTPPGQPATAAGTADRRSLDEMFRLLSGRADAAPAPVAGDAPAPLPATNVPPGEGPALFRRI